MPVNSSPNRTSANLELRLWGADLARFLCFHAILIFHLSYALWARDGEQGIGIAFGEPFETYARAFVFGGFAVLLISFFLFGLRGGWGKRRMGLVLLGFTLIWSFTAEDFPYLWDVYPLLLVAVGWVTLLRRAGWPAWLMTLVGAVTLSTPFWILEGVWDLPLWLEAILWGSCHRGLGLGDWPLLPWAALPVFGYGLGALTRHSNAGRWTRWDWWWIPALGLSLPFVGSYFVTPLGDGFSCYVFRRPPVEFWAHQFWILFLLRLSFVFLRPASWKDWLARRAVNRSFFLVYFLHYPLIFFFAEVARQLGYAHETLAYWVIFLATLFLLEILPVVIGRFFVNNEATG